MAWRKNPAVAANGITAREYAEAVKDGVKQGGGTKSEVRRAGQKAFKSAK